MCAACMGQPHAGVGSVDAVGWEDTGSTIAAGNAARGCRKRCWVYRLGVLTSLSSSKQRPNSVPEWLGPLAPQSVDAPGHDGTLVPDGIYCCLAFLRLL